MTGNDYSIWHWIAVFAASAIALFMYVAPTAIAWERKHKHLAAVFALNLLLGWTLVGWAVALVWSLTAHKPMPEPDKAPAVEDGFKPLFPTEPAAERGQKTDISPFQLVSGLVICSMIFALVLLYSADSHKPTAAAREPEYAAPLPSHYFAYDDGKGHYGYSVQLDDIDKAQGIVSKPYAMFMLIRYPEPGAPYEFATAHIQNQVVYRCRTPCDTVYSQSLTTGETEVMPVTPNTILWEVVQDVTSGQLKPGQGNMY